MTNWIQITKDNEHIAREKLKARQLRKTNWWKNNLAKGICYYCQQKFEQHELTMDHIVPLVREGKSTKANVVPCCKECNSKKKYLTPVDMVLKKIKKEDTKKKY